MEQVICKMCGVMKPLNGECETCKSLFQHENATLAPVEQIPVQQAYNKPSNTYTMNLDNGSTIDVYMYGVNKIVAFLKDANGAHVSSEEFSDIEKFKATVISLKTIIAEELKKLEEYKKLIGELGFEEIDE